MADRLARERLLTALLDSAEEAILSVALDGTIETWSAGAERLYGYTAQEMTGQSLSRLLPLYELPSMETFLSQAGRNGCPSTDLGERLHKNGSRILLADPLRQLAQGHQVLQPAQTHQGHLQEDARVTGTPQAILGTDQNVEPGRRYLTRDVCVEARHPAYHDRGRRARTSREEPPAWT